MPGLCLLVIVVSIAGVSLLASRVPRGVVSLRLGALAGGGPRARGPS